MLDETKPVGSKKGLLVILLLPVAVMAVGTWLFFFQQGWVNAGATNKGYLLSPPTSLQALGFQQSDLHLRQWRVILVSTTACIDLCLQSAERLHNVRKLLGKDSPRLLPVLSAEYSEAATQLKDWPFVQANHKLLQEKLSGFKAPLVDHYVLLADPHGNVILFYTPDQIGSALLADLKRLLRLSRIG